MPNKKLDENEIIVCETIRTAVYRDGRSVTAIADAAGISQAYLNRVMNCHNAPTLATINKIAYALGKTVRLSFVAPR